MLLKPDKSTDRLYIHSEGGFDTDFFNPTAHKNFVEKLKRDKNVTGILIDGATARLDRPEFLNEMLSYWNKSSDECEDATVSIPYHEQYQHMLEIQIQILRSRLLEIKKAAPKAAIALCIPTDDTHFSVTALINELVRYKKSQGSKSAKDTRGEIKEKLKIIKDAEAEIKSIENERKKIAKVEEKLNKEIEQAKDKIDQLSKKAKAEKAGAKYAKEIKALRDSITKAKAEISAFSKPKNKLRRDKQNAAKRIQRAEESKVALEKKLKREEVALTLFRHKKSRPEHQKRTHEFVAYFLKAYTDLCNDLGINLVTKPGVLKFGNLVVDYAHSRHRTWTVVENRFDKLIMAYHGQLSQENRNQIARMVEQVDNVKEIKVEELTLEQALERPEIRKELIAKAKKERVHIILETGHSGEAGKQTQKVADIAEEINFRNQASFCPQVADDHITFVMAPPFEDQDRIARYIKGNKPARMKLGIPLNTTNAEVFRRWNKGSVSGLCVIQRNSHDVIQTEWTQFQDFIDGSVLVKPDFYPGVWISSDEHKASPEENLAAQIGLQELVKQHVTEPFEFRGAPVYGWTYFNLGDMLEANSSKWPDRFGHKPDPARVLRQAREALKTLNKNNPEEVYNFLMWVMSLALAGSVESMEDVLDRGTNYLMDYLDILMPHSKQQWVLAVVPGNHVYDIFRKLGMKDSAFFKQRLKERGIEYFEVGIDSHFVSPDNEEKARVALGGHSNALILFLKGFGRDVNGKTLAVQPVDLLLQHNPKGSIQDAGKSAAADVTFTGHKHSNKMRLYKTGNNCFRVVYECASLQAVSSTEKYYAGGIPRTQAAHYVIMPKPGDFTEITIPAFKLNQVFRDSFQKTK